MKALKLRFSTLGKAVGIPVLLLLLAIGTLAGHGRADKERVGRAVVSRYGVGVGTSEHMRDAVAIAHTALVRLETERKLAAQGVLAVGKGKGKRARAATP